MKHYIDNDIVQLHFCSLQEVYQRLYGQAVGIDQVKSAYYEGIIHGLKMAKEIINEHIRIENEVTKILQEPSKATLLGQYLKPAPEGSYGTR